MTQAADDASTPRVLKDGRGLTAGGRTLVMLLFLISGLTGLVYEVTWVKVLSLIFGSTIYSVSTILTTFFFGMGIGGYLMGRWADRLRRPFLTYCFLEIIIAVYAVAVPLIFEGVGDLYIGLQKQMGYGAALAGPVRFFASFVVLALPTICMGATLPLLARVVVGSLDSVGRHIGGLYAINTWGAVVGCFLAGFFFMPELGVSLTLKLAAGTNFSIGVLGILLARRIERDIIVRPEERGAAPANTSLDQSAAIPAMGRALLWTAVFVSGFTVLSLEVIWTRILVFFLRYTVYAFSTMLTAFLVGLALGAVLSSRVVDHRRKLILWLGGVQVLVGFLAVVSIRVAGYLESANIYLLETLTTHAESPSFALNMTAKFLLCFMVMLIPSVAMGMVFPSLLKIWVSQLGRIGRRTGSVYFVNTVGAMCGSLAAGFVMIPAFGLTGAPFVVAVVNVVLGAVLILWDTAGLRRVVGSVICMAILAGAFVLIPPGTPSVEILNLVPKQSDDSEMEIELVEIREGNTATVTVLEKRRDFGGHIWKARSLGINGVIVAEGSTGTRTDRLNAYIPLLIHPAPKDVLIMGAAAGLTMDACQQFPVVEQVDGVEIVPAVVELMPEFREFNGDVVNNPRVDIIVDDVRNYLEITDKKYDVIVNEAWLSVVTGSTPLYSKEFYALVKSRLKPGGIFSLGPGKLDRYIDLTNSTVLTEFPFGYTWYFPEVDYVMCIATLEEISFAGVRDRWREPGVAQAMAGVKLSTPDHFMACLTLGPEDTRELTGNDAICTDDKPVFEFLQTAVYFLDARRQQPEKHDPDKFREMVKRQPKIEKVFADSGDPPAVTLRHVQAMQYMLQARLAEQRNDVAKVAELQNLARLQLSPQ